MATLYRHPKSRYWYAYFFDRTGKRIRRSTGKVGKRDARDIANALELEEKKAKRKEVVMQRDLAEIVAKAAREADKGTFTLEKARQCLADLYQISNHEELPNFTVAQWLEKWLEGKEPEIAKKTFSRYTSSVDTVIKALGKRSHLKLELFTTQHGKALREKLIQIKGKARNATINVKLSDFKTALTAAYEERLIQHNVGTAIKLLPEDDSKIVTHFEPEEVRKLIAEENREDRKLLVLLAAETGLRLGDVVTMKIEAIKFERRCLVVSPGKQARNSNKKKTVTVPLSDETMSRLKRFCSGRKGDLFPNLAEKTSSTHSTNFNNLMKRAGVAKQVTLDNGEMGHRSFHSLRHSFATWLLQADVEKDVRKSLMAHSKDDVHAIYAVHDEGTLRRAVEKLPSLG